MEIHRPKGLHGWRELAKEIGVITIGIAIALGGEQTLEWLHRRTEVSHAREALRAEIAANASIARLTIQQERCLAVVADSMAAWAKGGPRLSDTRPAGLSPPLHTSAWEVVKVGAAAHMPLEERMAYARFYDHAPGVQANLATEIAVWMRLAGATGKAELTPADAQRVLDDVTQARFIGSIRSGSALGILQLAKAMGVDPEPMSAGNTAMLATTCSIAGMAPPKPEGSASAR